MVEAEHQKSKTDIETVNKSVADPSDSASQANEQDENEQSEVEELINNHDLIGVDGIIKNQKYEIDKKKL